MGLERFMRTVAALVVAIAMGAAIAAPGNQARAEGFGACISFHTEERLHVHGGSSYGR